MPNIFDRPASATKNGRLLRVVELLHNEYTAWVILAISLCLTVVAYFVADSFVTRRVEDRFEFKVLELEKAIRNRALIYEQVLWGGVGLFNAKAGTVNRQAFARYVETLNINENWPGIQGVGFSVPLKASELAAHETQIRAEGFPDYSVKPAGERDEYSAIIYLEPFDWRNQRAFGFDMWSNETRREAMARARDTGRAATSSIITLVQETETNVQRGFLMYTPVYRDGAVPETLTQRREQFVGWVYAPFRAGNLMQGILPADDPEIEFELFDGVELKPESLLFDSNDSLHLDEANHQPDLSKVVRLELQGHPWTIYFNTPRNYLENLPEARQPAYIALAGTVVDLLLFYVIYAMYLTKKQMRLVGEDWRRVLEQAPNALIVIDRSGTIFSSNRQAEALFGYAQGELRGLLIDVVLPHGDPHLTRLFWEQNLSDASLHELGNRGLVARRKDGVCHSVDVGLNPLHVANGDYVVVSVVDTREWNRVRSELEGFNQQLQQKNEEMEQFIYTVSHDLKSPLVTIGGFASHLEKSLTGQLNEKQMHQLARIRANVDQMEGLLGDLLQLSRVIRQDVERERVLIEPLVQRVVDALEASMREAETELLIEVHGLAIFANARMAAQCLQNLLANAIQYRDPMRPLQLRVSAEEDALHTRIHVQDNGIGIDPRYHDKVFRIFERLDQGEGTGVGLAIVKTVMEKHQGRVVLHSEAGRGSVFTLEFPRV